MATPQDYLPLALTDTTIQTLLSDLTLPPATSIEALQVTAAFHSIYLLHFPSSAIAALSPAQSCNPDGSMTLVLRVSGDHIPQTKTMNEVAVMRWVKDHTSVPVPAVVRFDDGTGNVLCSEFTLLERVPGQSVDKMYGGLSEEAKTGLVQQLVDVVLELNGHEWNHVGGLRVAEDEDIVPGPVLEDTFWLVPDIGKLWGPEESVESLNPKGPYDSHTGLVEGYLKCFIHAINTHPSLAWLSKLNPRLQALSNRLPSLSSLARTRLVLAHKDLHFANIMATSSGRITGILDWEFAGVVPVLRWDPVRAFLWNGKEGEEAHAEKERMRVVFEAELERRGVERWWEQGVDKEVEDVWTVVKFVRALVEVCPRGQRGERVGGWKESVEQALTNLGV